MYLHLANETLCIMESILDSISNSRPLDNLYSTKSISPHKLYLVKWICTDIQMWSRAIIEEYVLAEHKVSNNLQYYLSVLLICNICIMFFFSSSKYSLLIMVIMV